MDNTQKIDAKAPYPKDRAAYAIFLLLGVGALLAWNAFVTAVDYFHAYYREYHPDRTIPVLYMLINVCTTAFLVKYGKEMNIDFRIQYGFWAFTIAMIAVPFSDLFLYDSSNTLPAFLTIVFFVAVVGVANGFVQGSLFGMCGPLPLHYTCGVVIGTAVSGVFISVVRILTKVAFGDGKNGLRLGIYVYFLFGGLYSLLCIFLYSRILPNTKVIKWHQRVKSHGQGDVQPLLKSSIDEEEGSTVSFTKAIIDNSSKLKHVYFPIWKYAIAIYINYLVTLSIFPGVLAEDVTSEVMKHWYSLILITIYNVSDMLGKMFPESALVSDGSILLVGSVLRLAFIGIFAVGVKEQMGEVFFITNTFFLGATNGYLTSCAMAVAPAKVNPEDAEVAGTMMTFFLLFGLSSGAMASWLWLVL